ncbi:glycosyltransferase family 4 protein [Aeromonas sp. 3925]|uniref:glycosyltransferase n=1 Tax=Aeromonas genomosp. paramedia TaxID=3086176 RepID=UPI001FFCA1C5|nr:glycosyltransferase [Aeromonas genomosp. paramedia]MCK2084370.1 glycosyltransferase family 4 protein [Aeromonas genomosp. paramedia]
MRKRVLIYLDSMQPAGGIERVVATLANVLCIDNEVTILVKDRPSSFYVIDDRIKFDSINSALVFDMSSRIKRAKRILGNIIDSIRKLHFYFKDHDYDCVYVTTPRSYLECLLVLKSGRDIIASEHGARSNYNVVYRAIKLAYKLSRAYVLPTTDDYNFFASNGFPAIHIPHLRPPLKYKKTDTAQKTVINIGRFTPDKRQILLIKLWADIIKNNIQLKDWVLLLVGTGELQNDINSIISELNICDNVQIVPPQINVDELYTKASIFALTSSSEGFGMVVLEALSFGLPVISFDCPSGPKDIISHEVDGFLVEMDNFTLYQKRLTELMLCNDLRAAMSENGFVKGQQWNESNIIDKWRGLL